MTRDLIDKGEVLKALRDVALTYGATWEPHAVKLSRDAIAALPAVTVVEEALFCTGQSDTPAGNPTPQAWVRLAALPAVTVGVTEDALADMLWKMDWNGGPDAFKRKARTLLSALDLTPAPVTPDPARLGERCDVCGADVMGLGGQLAHADKCAKPDPATIREAARVLYAAMTARPQLVDPFDAIDPEVERLAIEFSGQGGDAVIVLETAEKFMLAGLRALIQKEPTDDR